MRGRGKGKNTLAGKSRTILTPDEKIEAQREIEAKKLAALKVANQRKVEETWEDLDNEVPTFQRWLEMEAYELGVDEMAYENLNSLKELYANPEYIVDTIILARFLVNKLDFKEAPEMTRLATAQMVDYIQDNYDISPELKKLTDAIGRGSALNTQGNFLSTRSSANYKLAKDVSKQLQKNEIAYEDNTPEYYQAQAEAHFADLAVSILEASSTYTVLEDAANTVIKFEQAKAVQELVEGQVQLSLATNKPSPTRDELSTAASKARRKINPYLQDLIKPVVDSIIASK